ncbi:DUF1934 domain-containing protein [Alkalicoccus daliensis]|uniref:Uncharacterized beta-barrel protein YwiB, DUF1934 family n=1 Tax=Alkalicoccus daliensis TaxID=745820 RepID=A0A1H0L1S6_9BACI|nr:DUF1934 domain-containing protein [Alkalicoccus daliensis]SDO61996.1 Uncharacterized beta-barrel protein YwiB, DUF1934 family [Alkalicoccus daliensis]
MTENSMPVDIKIRTTIRDGKQKERHSMDAFGHLSWRGGLIVLRFQEPREDSEQKTMQTMQLRDGRLSVKRDGAISMNQRFVEGVKTEGTYRSPYGPMHMITDTESIQYTWDDEKKKGIISLIYVLTLQGSKTGTYSMEIVFEEGEKA